MLNGDKAHIYKLLEYVKHELMVAEDSLQKESVVIDESERKGLLPLEIQPFRREIGLRILRSMTLFKSNLTNDIEGSGDLSFDSVLIKVEYRCEEWRCLIKENLLKSTS